MLIHSRAQSRNQLCMKVQTISTSQYIKHTQTAISVNRTSKYDSISRSEEHQNLLKFNLILIWINVFSFLLSPQVKCTLPWISKKSLIEVRPNTFSITHSESHETFPIPVSRHSLGMQKTCYILLCWNKMYKHPMILINVMVHSR